MADAGPTQGVKITLHWLDQSRAHRIAWLLEELGLEYELKIYKRKNMQAPPELKAIHPLGKSPVITLQPADGGEPRVIAESGLIVEYLTEHFGPALIPSKYQAGKDGQLGGETDEWMRYRYYMHYAEGSLMPLMFLAVFMDQIRNARVPFFIKPITRQVAGQVDSVFLNKNLKSHMVFLENQLTTNGGDFICGKELTGADILMIYPLSAGATRAGLNAKTYPKLAAYVDRIFEREAYKRANARIEQMTDASPHLSIGPMSVATKKHKSRL